MKIAVVGAGVAGTAAAWMAKRLGAEVTLIHDRPGASALASGALDLLPWNEPSSRERALEPELLELAVCLGWSLGTDPGRVATTAGVLRPARGRDAAVLDLEPLAGKCVGVVDVVRDDWDGPAIARALGVNAWATRTGTRFESRPVELLSNDAEQSYPSYDFALACDAPERRKRLGDELAKARAGIDAWLTGPWLGIAADVAGEVSRRLGMPVGEALSPPGGAAGARFELRRDALIADGGIETIRARVGALSAGPDGISVVVATEDEGEDKLAADAVVLALGGVATGGIVLDAARPQHAGGACFHLSLEAPVGLELDGEPVERVSTLFGVDFAAYGLELLERVGIACEGVRARGSAPIYAAGDCVAGRPRTALQAAQSGIAAARAALGRG